MLQRLKARFAHGGSAGRTSEDDTPTDPGTARSRAVGGSTESLGTQDRNSSTGTTENETFVGRASGDETADPGASGAERRSNRGSHEGEGAARDD